MKEFWMQFKWCLRSLSLALGVLNGSHNLDTGILPLHTLYVTSTWKMEEEEHITP